ncbi:GntR family transcriptional regulator [Ligilactobacillus equi]|uniref:GntR family transcriptional regulator n=1 Tax=Ligilactobacillus equi TaxID=137357 RepID=UPI002ED258F3
MLLTGSPQKIQTYQALYDDIINLKYIPGQKISEKELSETYEIGRTPLREIIIQLKSDGLVETVPQSGTYITKINLKSAKDARFVRESIEVKIIREAAVKISESEIVDLEGVLKKQHLLTDKEDFHKEFMYLDNSFHAMIYSVVKKDNIWNWIQEISTQLLRFRNLRLIDKQFSWEKLVDDHEQILLSLKKHDFEESGYLVARHTHLMLDEKSKLVKKFANYFSE